MKEETTDNMIVKLKLVSFIAIIFTVASLSFTIAGLIFSIGNGETALTSEISARKTNDKENEAMTIKLEEDYDDHLKAYHNEK